MSDRPLRRMVEKDIELDVDGWDIPTVIRRLADIKDRLSDTKYRLVTSDYGITIFYEVPESDDEYQVRVKQWEYRCEKDKEAIEKKKLKKYKEFLKLKSEFEPENKNDLH